MANDRMYIKCNVCGDEICIAKSFGLEFSLNANIVHEIDNFLYDHAFCGESDSVGDFSITYESNMHKKSGFEFSKILNGIRKACRNSDSIPGVSDAMILLCATNIYLAKMKNENQNRCSGKKADSIIIDDCN